MANFQYFSSNKIEQRVLNPFYFPFSFKDEEEPSTTSYNNGFCIKYIFLKWNNELIKYLSKYHLSLRRSLQL